MDYAFPGCAGGGIGLGGVRRPLDAGDLVQVGTRCDALIGALLARGGSGVGFQRAAGQHLDLVGAALGDGVAPLGNSASLDA